MELTYLKDEKIPAILDIEAGDTLQTPLPFIKNIRVLAVIDEAIITESALNPMWSNRVYSAQQVYSLGCEVIKKAHTQEKV